jgi:sigma-E factor negative regulatory protein RseA
MMKEKLYEQISALVDNELGEPEQALLVRRFASDDELYRCLLRYQLISDALQNHLPERIDPAFSRRLQSAVRKESAPGNSAVPGDGGIVGLLRPVAGLAVAASVAIVAVVSLQSVRQEPAALPAVASAPSSGDYIRAPEGHQPALQPPAEKQLDIYLVNHNEYAVNRRMQGMLPYMRIVGHEMNSGNKE